MRQVRSQSWVRSGTSAAVLAFVLSCPCARAWAQAPSRPAGMLERAAALVDSGAFLQAAGVLRQLVAVEPANRRAKELLAFALESAGDLEGEREVRAALAAEYPEDARLQGDYARVLERSGEEAGALRAYRRARDIGAGSSAAAFDAAIERMRGRTATEVGVPVSFASDPEATSSSIQAGAALGFGARNAVALVLARQDAEGRTRAMATRAVAAAASVVLRGGRGAYGSVGPRVHVVSPRGRARGELGIGGALAGRAPVGRNVEVDGRAEAGTPWDESPVAILHGGRTSAAEGHVYAHALSRRLLLQAGVRRRRLSILAGDAGADRRTHARQTLLLGGADLVVWSRPGNSVRGEMLDESLTAPASTSPAMTLAYRHYDVTTRATPEFRSRIGLASRAAVDEASIAATLASARRDLALELRGGLAFDAARGARQWRLGGTLTWAPTAAARLGLGYEEANEAVAGLLGDRRAGRLSLHVDL